MVAQIQMRRDSAADWTAANPVLAEGEFGFETDTRKYKIGDGATAWNSLSYAVFDGFTVGRRYQWDSASTADSDPGAGNLRPNNAAIASVTRLFFDNADYAGGTATAFLDGLYDGGETGNRGILFIQSASDPDVYVEFQVTGSVVDGTGYRKVSVTYLSHVGTITDDDVVVISFQKEGPTAAGDFKADGSVPMTADLDMDGSGLVNLASINSGQIAGLRNRIIHGAMMMAQRGTSFTGGTTNADDVYTLDRWVLLSDGNDAVDVTQSTEAPTGGLYSIALDVETTNKKFGILQIIEQKNCIGLIGNTVTLSFKAKVSSTTKLDNLKAAIVSWDGTADSVTSDIVSAWGAEGTNPTLVANWTYENSPANLTPTTSWASYSVTAAVDTASTKNIAVFIWSDVTDTTAGDFLYITNVQLEVGSVATPFEMRPSGTELALCQRYYNYNLYQFVGGGVTPTTSNRSFYSAAIFPVAMRATPTLTKITESLNNMTAGAFNDISPYYTRYSAQNIVANDAIAAVFFAASAEL